MTLEVSPLPYLPRTPSFTPLFMPPFPSCYMLHTFCYGTVFPRPPPPAPRPPLRPQADLQRMRLEAAQRDKERALAESQAREAAAAERAKLQVGRVGRRRHGHGTRRRGGHAGRCAAFAAATRMPRRVRRGHWRA